MRFERGIGVKRSLGIGMSFDTLQRGQILKIKKSFSTDRWGVIQGHVEGWNKCREGRYLIVKSTPVYSDGGRRIGFRIRQGYTLEQSRKIRESLLSQEEMEYDWEKNKIFGMSRLQFNRRLEVVE